LLVGKPEGRRSLGRLRRRWLDNICRGRMGWCGLDWSGSGQGQALANSVLNLRVP
jgi:hypothetical protein